MTKLDWCDMGSMPKDSPVDILYVNETLEPASCGILYDARTFSEFKFFMTGGGAKIPAAYCVGWRHARIRTASFQAAV